MKSKLLKTSLFLFIIVIVVFGFRFGRDYYIKASLYKPSDKEVTDVNRYVIMKDKFGTNVTIFLPKTYQKTKPNKWILIAHGSNGSSLDMLKLPGENSMLKPLLDSGYVIVVPNYRNVINWGNNQGIEDFIAAYELGEKNFNLEKKPYLILQSMGGLIGLTSIAQDKIKPKAVVGIYPVTNLKAEYNGGKDGYIPKLIKDAYKIKKNDDFEKQTKSYDSVNDYDGKTYIGIPYLLISSYDDKVVPRKTNSDEFAKKVNGVGGNVTVISHNGDHGDKSAFKFKEIISFFNEH